MNTTVRYLRCLLAAIVTAVLFSGCIPFLHPLYTEDTMVFEPELLGTWKFSDDEGTWTFAAADNNTRYRLTTVDGKGERGVFEATLVALDGHLFLDLLPVEPEPTGNDFYRAHILRTHSILRLREGADTDLTMAILDPEWLDKHLKETPDALRFEKTDDRIIVTATTAELQAFFRKHAGNPDVFADPSGMNRVANEHP